MIALEVTDNLADMRRRMTRLKDRDVGAVNAKALGRVGEMVVTQSKKNYLRAMGPGESPRRNDQRGPGSLRSIHGERGLRGRIAHKVDTNYMARVGTLLSGPGFEYAAIHEFGGFTGKAQMPARPYIAPALDDAFSNGAAEREMERTFARELQGRFER